MTETRTSGEQFKAWRWLALILATALLLAAHRGHAAEPDDDDVESSEGSQMEAPVEQGETSSHSDLLTLGLRLDSAFSAGASYEQGFEIPSLRLTAFGNLNKSISYRVSLGQTREFSSVQLPQIIPVEAYMDFALLRNSDAISSPAINWRFGMFTPTFNPWWSPDLSDIELPDYNVVHKAVFLSRDLGTELSYQMSPGGLKIGGGVFNGSGIISENTNDSKAFTGFIQEGFGTDDLRVDLGASTYGLFQSTIGSINYKSDWVADAWLSLSFGQRLNLMLDGFTGNFAESTGTTPVNGVGVSTFVTVVDWMKLFGRYERLDHSPDTTNYLSLSHAEIGPVLLLDRSVKVFALFEYYDYGDGTTEHSLMVRVRLNI